MRLASATLVVSLLGTACSYDFDLYGADPDGAGGAGAAGPATTSSSTSTGLGGQGGGSSVVPGPCPVVGKSEPFRADFSTALGADWTVVGLAATDSGALGVTVQGDVEESSATQASEFVLDDCWVDVKILSTGPELGLVDLVGAGRALRVMIRPYPGVPDSLVLVDDATPLGSTTQVLVGRSLRVEAMGSELHVQLGDGDSFETVLKAERPGWLDEPVRLRLGQRRQSELDGRVTIYFDDVNPP